MANKPPIHVLSRDDGWAVVREGNDRATSVHPTQAEAAEAGLVRRTGRSETVVVLPRLIDAGSNFFAALFAVLAHCAQAAAEEIGAAL